MTEKLKERKTDGIHKLFIVNVLGVLQEITFSCLYRQISKLGFGL